MKILAKLNNDRISSLYSVEKMNIKLINITKRKISHYLILYYRILIVE